MLDRSAGARLNQSPTVGVGASLTTHTVASAGGQNQSQDSPRLAAVHGDESSFWLWAAQRSFYLKHVRVSTVRRATVRAWRAGEEAGGCVFGEWRGSGVR